MADFETFEEWVKYRTETQRLSSYANHSPQLPGRAGKEKIGRKPGAHKSNADLLRQKCSGEKHPVAINR